MYHSRINFLPDDFSVNETSFNAIPSNSFICLDDFSMHYTNKNVKNEFLKIINYKLRHSNITLILVIHNLYNIGMYNNILLAPHLFISYSNLGAFILG